MHNTFLKIFIGLAVLGVGTACKPAKCRNVRKDGVYLQECSCPAGQIMALTKNHGTRCFERCDKCPNGFCHKSKCYCFDLERGEGRTCPKVCPNCENGWCSSATKCECNPGFGGESCLPLCPGGCRNGYCSYPGVCSCEVGYYFLHTTNRCEPLCFDECVNGFCSSPGVCSCDPGYKMLEDKTCAPRNESRTFRDVKL